MGRLGWCGNHHGVRDRRDGAGLVTADQATGKAAGAGEKELDAALRKLSEGRPDEALALIRERAAKHPEWPPPLLILARMMLDGGMAVPARRVLEQAAVESPKQPDVYLMFGRLDLADGRWSDAHLNFETAQVSSPPAIGPPSKSRRTPATPSTAWPEWPKPARIGTRPRCT